MSSPRWQKKLSSLKLEFWLPLPLLGITFWLIGGWITDRVLSRPYHSLDQLQAETPLEVRLSFTVETIQAEINKNQGITTVEVTTTDAVIKKLEFQFPVTDFRMVEATIAQKLGLPIDTVRKLVRYRVQSSQS